MPMRELQAYVTELPRLRAARAIADAQAVSIGLGLKPEGRAGILRDWQRALEGGASVVRAGRDPARLAALASMTGIGFVTVKPASKP